MSQDCWALSLNAFAALLISPISWSHHGYGAFRPCSPSPTSASAIAAGLR